MLKRTYRQSIRLVIEGEFRLLKLRKLAAQSSNPPGTRHPHLAILPPHPQHPFGSRGDQAMTFAVISEFRKLHPEGSVSIIVSPDCDLEGFEQLNVMPMPIWAKDRLLDDSPLSVISSLVMVGADVMDGYYWPITVLRGLDLCERARIFGAQVGVLGFSFNSEPHPLCVRALQSLHSDIRLLARDPVSAARFAASVSTRISLVADAAFWMQPNSSPSVKNVQTWCAAQVATNNSIVGFNLHSLLLDVPGACDLHQAVVSAAAAISETINKNNVAILLIPHDFRGVINDKTILKLIWSQLDLNTQKRVFLPDSEFNADELKSVASLCSIILTGRMHLAIASLGMGVPIAAIAYQDKFEGLFEHFHLSKEHIVQPSELGNSNAVARWMQSAINARDSLKREVSNSLPAVLELSFRNFAWLR